MAVTDLLSRIPISPTRRPAAADAPGGAGDAVGGWDAFSAPAEFRPPSDLRPSRAARAPLPSWVVLALGSVALSALGLIALFVLRPFDATPEVSAAVEIAMPAAPRPALATAPAATTASPSATFGADSQPVSADVIARLEAASNEPLHGELTQLLDAIQVGFGDQSSQIDPALRPYTVRMASRFEWNPDTFRIAVSAPSADLAAARVATLRRVFGTAVAAQRLLIEPTTGPDALTLAPR